MEHFNISEFLRQNGFLQTRDSEKRDAFQKTFFYALHDTNYTVEVIIYHNSGISKYNNCPVLIMSVDFIDNNGKSTVFSGICPNTFDKASDLFEALMPSLEFIQKHYNK